MKMDLFRASTRIFTTRRANAEFRGLLLRAPGWTSFWRFLGAA